MKTVLVSMFMDAAAHLPRYFRQVNALRDRLESEGGVTQLCLVEGDSVDGTFDKLKPHLRPTDLLSQCHHGGQKYGSVDVAQRWVQISQVCNHLLATIPPCERVVYVECDLIWKPDTMVTLLEHLDRYQDAPRVDLVSPMCMKESASVPGEFFFYDWFGYRAEGEKFHPQYLHPMLHRSPARLLPMESTGSCIVMRGEVAGRCRFTVPEQAIISFCHDARAKGYGLWLDRESRVVHP